MSWAVDAARARRLPPLGGVHLAAAYVAWAALSAAVHAAPSAWPKVLGMAELAVLLALAAAVAESAGGRRAIVRAVALSAVAAGLAAVAGEALFLAGVPTPLVGGYGDLVPGAYARVRAGLFHPNLLASFCIFAAAVVRSGGEALPDRGRRALLALLALTVLLTFSRGILAYVAAALVARTAPARRAVAVCGVVACAVVLSALTLGNLALDPLRPDEARLREAPSLRRQALSSSWETLRAHPLFGSGPATLPGKADGQAVDAHFTPLNVAATLGVPALAAFLALLALLWRVPGRDRHLWAGLLGFGLEALVQDVEDFRHVWVVLGLTATPSAARGLHR